MERRLVEDPPDEFPRDIRPSRPRALRAGPRHRAGGDGRGPPGPGHRHRRDGRGEGRPGGARPGPPRARRGARGRAPRPPPHRRAARLGRGHRVPLPRLGPRRGALAGRVAARARAPRRRRDGPDRRGRLRRPGARARARRGPPRRQAGQHPHRPRRPRPPLRLRRGAPVRRERAHHDRGRGRDGGLHVAGAGPRRPRSAPRATSTRPAWWSTRASPAAIPSAPPRPPRPPAAPPPGVCRPWPPCGPSSRPTSAAPSTRACAAIPRPVPTPPRWPTPSAAPAAGCGPPAAAAPGPSRRWPAPPRARASRGSPSPWGTAPSTTRPAWTGARRPSPPRSRPVAAVAFAWRPRGAALCAVVAGAVLVGLSAPLAGLILGAIALVTLASGWRFGRITLLAAAGPALAAVGLWPLLPALAGLLPRWAERLWVAVAGVVATVAWQIGAGSDSFLAGGGFVGSAVADLRRRELAPGRGRAPLAAPRRPPRGGGPGGRRDRRGPVRARGRARARHRAARPGGDPLDRRPRRRPDRHRGATAPPPWPPSCPRRSS